MFNVQAFLAYIFITAYTPGPNNIMSMSHSGKYGLRRAILFNLGILAGFSVMMCLCTLFSATLLMVLPALKPVMLVIGAGYIVRMAWKTLRSGSLVDPGTDNGAPAFGSGMALQFVNPKTILYGITSMSSYILPHFASIPVVLAFALLLAFIGFTGSLCWAFFGAAFRNLFNRYASAVNAVMAVMLLYCAASLFL
ncbi:LysE family transporter [Paenibacillus sp. NFR01]|uniref:LysE family transporter n=1 Tax=Paenibacillus sp. NFR01 TaxID=1566279 RepID=UPI0008BAD5EF|nr:LysE family transporter [Paenibacillus sp. NFR01]SET40113.1 Threonine/homoserine/homoserine lactone efflux protein [Paenibacillus sp. NFR01]